jgi:hypothetical protein
MVSMDEEVPWFTRTCCQAKGEPLYNMSKGFGKKKDTDGAMAANYLY